MDQDESYLPALPRPSGFRRLTFSIYLVILVIHPKYSVDVIILRCRTQSCSSFLYSNLFDRFSHRLLTLLTSTHIILKLTEVDVVFLHRRLTPHSTLSRISILKLI